MAGLEPFLQSSRLVVRHWAEADLPLAEALWGDPAVTRWIGGPLAAAAVRARLERELATQREFGVQYWPLFLRSGAGQCGSHLGCCGLRPYRPEAGIYELGFHLRPEYWGHGYATEAARVVIAYAFDVLGAASLFAGHHPGNAASGRLLAKLGFRYTHAEFYAPTGLEHPSYTLAAPRPLCEPISLPTPSNPQPEGPHAC
jgi:RimJ/RimL family protein N-acetyltransferase